MINAALQPNPVLRHASRIGPLAGQSDQLTLHEVALLLFAGGLAAAALALFSPGLNIPGSALLRGALPVVCGVALVPKQANFC